MLELRPLETDYLTKKEIEFLEHGYVNSDFSLKRKARGLALRFLIMGVIEEEELKVVAELCRVHLYKAIISNELKVFRFVFDLLVNNHAWYNRYIDFKYLYENDQLEEFAYEFKDLAQVYASFSFDFFTDNVLFSNLSELQKGYELQRNFIKMQLRNGRIDYHEAIYNQMELVNNLMAIMSMSTVGKITWDTTSKRKQFEAIQEKLIEESMEHDLNMEKFKYITDIVEYWNETSELLKSRNKQ